MTFRAVSLFLLVVGAWSAASLGCVGQHNAELVEVQSDSCVTCHLADYEGTANPVHAGMYPTTCGNCHTTDAWRPALEGAHPEDKFQIAAGPHKAVDCVDCHNAAIGPSTAGQNADCIGCHTGEHSQAKMNDAHKEEPEYVWDSNRPNFCLECHPNGRKE